MTPLVAITVLVGGLGSVIVGLTNGISPGLAFLGGFSVPWLLTLALVWLVDR